MTLEHVWILFALVAVLGFAQFVCGVATGRSIAQCLRQRLAALREVARTERPQEV